MAVKSFITMDPARVVLASAQNFEHQYIEVNKSAWIVSLRLIWARYVVSSVLSVTSYLSTPWKTRVTGSATPALTRFQPTMLPGSTLKSASHHSVLTSCHFGSLFVVKSVGSRVADTSNFKVQFSSLNFAVFLQQNY